MKKTVVVLVLIVVLFIALMVGYRVLSSPPDTGLVTTFSLERGWGVRKVAAALQDSGLVRSRFVVIWKYRQAFAPAPLQAGKYLLSDTMRVETILGMFTRGEVIPVPTHWVTIPPGVRLEEGIDLLAQQMERPQGEFMDVAKDTEFLASMGFPRMEGYLFPETYEFADSLTAVEILSRIASTGEQVMTPGWKDSCAALGLTPEQAVVLASIVEREGKDDSELQLISGVFLLRLRRDMRLESCATVQYALGEVRERLLFSDLEVESPYNTYRHQGLPPGAICSPGPASLRAVARPDTTERYLFFVSREDGSGQHLFARTSSEHSMNIERVR